MEDCITVPVYLLGNVLGDLLWNIFGYRLGYLTGKKYPKALG